MSHNCDDCRYRNRSYDTEPCFSCQVSDGSHTHYRNWAVDDRPLIEETMVFRQGQDAPLGTGTVAWAPVKETQASDGSTASYYELPAGATELQDLISHLDMNAQMGEIFRACYRYGRVEHSPRERDLKKIIFYAQAELKRLEKLGG